MKFSAERRDALLLFLIVLLGLVLRVYHLDHSSLWIDEGFTRLYSESSLRYLWTTGFHLESNPPGYYSLMHFWIGWFGGSEFALRFFSVLASLVALVLVYALGKELESSSIGLIAALFMAASPTEIWYAQEARTYALLHASVAIALLGLARYLGSSRSWGALGLYIVGSTAALYCHDTALLFVLAVNLAVVGMSWYDRSFLSRQDFVRWLGGNAVVGLAALPLVIAVLQHSQSPGVQWMPPVTMFEFMWVLRDFIGGPAANREFIHGHSLDVLLVLAVVGLLCWWQKLDRRALTLLVMTPALFILVVVLLSLHQSILIPRVFFWIWIPLSVVLAHLVVHGKKMRLVLLTLITLVFVIGLDALYFPFFPPKEDWRGLRESTQAEFAQADVIVLTAPIQTGCFAYYFPESLPRSIFWTPQFDSFPSNALIDFHERFNIPKLETESLRRLIESGKRVCILILNHDLTFFAEHLSAFPPPNRRFEYAYPHASQFHVLIWEGSGQAEKQLEGPKGSP